MTNTNYDNIMGYNGSSCQSGYHLFLYPSKYCVCGETENQAPTLTYESTMTYPSEEVRLLKEILRLVKEIKNGRSII